ncbi:Protein BUD31-like protein 1 [Triticum urartu]|uniref:Protein BUD31-like protein 1 n=1 Tax=Triticum urartu TaxID=4572 RepID=M8AK63_TRIUA|nr:Protein BUD31-like protein 1 [Triticum urartu]
MPKIKTSRVEYPEGWVLIEPTIRELDAKMREAENDTHDGKRKCEALWPIFRISHQRSRYIYDLFYKRKEISKELYEFCLDQGYADRNLIAKWKKPGYERLCCLRCIQTRDHNFATTCVCRVPKHLREEQPSQLDSTAVPLYRARHDKLRTPMQGGREDLRPARKSFVRSTAGATASDTVALAWGSIPWPSWNDRYALSSDPSPKYRMGQSCRKNKRKELSSVAAVVAESRKEQRDGPRCADDDGRTEFDGEVGGDDRRSSGDGGGQYVMRRDDGDGEMERVLEKQAELIGQYEAEEKAQTDWEKKFNDTRSSPNKGDVEADCHLQTKSGGEKLVVSRPPKNSSEEMAPTPAISAQGSSSYSTATRRSQDQQGDANSDGCSSRYTTSASSSGLGAVKAPSESSPSVSKVSDWSSSRFHDHADDQQGNIDVESVLQALQRARISLRQKLDRPLPPSQVTLALPAPGDECRTDLYNDDDDGSSSYRDGHVGSSPSRQEILALPAPEDYHGYHDHGSANCSTDGADTALTENPSPPQQEILALPAPGDDDGDGEDEVKVPVGSPGLFRLPTDSFPKDETLPAISNGHDAELRSIEVVAARHDTYRDDDGAGVSASAKQLYDPPTSGRCNVPPGSGFLSGIPGLPEDPRKGGGPLGDADLLMQPRLRVHHF